MIYCMTCGNALTETTFNGQKTLVCTFCGAVVVDTGGSYKYGGTFGGSVPARRFISEITKGGKQIEKQGTNQAAS